MDTWALTNLDRVNVDNTFHEWLTDSLAGATANRQIEGDDVTSFVTIASPTRYGNYAQISRKVFLISGTLETIKKAGRSSEIARQAMKQMRELKRDMEQALVGNQASSAGGAATARSLGGMESWIASTDNGGNGTRATSTASASTAAYSSGVTAPTDGSTTGALTTTALNEALKQAWLDGGNPRILLVGPTQKAAINTFTSLATRFTDVRATQQVPIQTAADVYVSDYGVHQVVLHRYMRSSVVLAIDPEYWAVGMFRAPRMETLAKTGDGEKRMILSEYTLIARNPNSSAKVAACS